MFTVEFFDKDNHAWCRVKPIGENYDQVFRLDRRLDLIERFPREYALYKGEAVVEEKPGTSLDKVVPEDLAKSLVAQGIRTAEDLAMLSDAGAQRVIKIDGLRFRDMARELTGFIPKRGRPPKVK